MAIRPYKAFPTLFSCGTGILPVADNGVPVPQRLYFLVEQASCLLLTMVQDISVTGIDIRRLINY
ncbi:MAG: hypothetical protein QQW96_12480 [Tychonema bourrellyi B0820]|uniref:hypothetical protein n=1 Tax=Tychonema bourrellyi TaxID=54313 RepID=UPI00117EE9A1|nr:hypothetical protein [Tychonema bourrellyi]MDQ2098449.1 hypothetical protein [Tychonema bourrellyi B0820]